MPGLSRIVARFANQKLVYWAKAGSDEFGKPTFADPVEVACRWEDKTRMIVLPDERRVMASASILTSTELKAGGLVKKGTLADWKALPSYPKVPTERQGGHEIIHVDGTPDIKAVEYVYEVYV